MPDETQKPQQTPQESVQETPTLIERAKEQADRLEKANAVYKTLLEKEEQMQARRILGGRSEAGTAPKEVDAEELAQQQALKLLEGTGINPFKNGVKK